MKWAGNAQSCYVVWGYVYLKVKSYKKMANENICYSRSRSWPSHMLHAHWVREVNLSVNVWIQTCYKLAPAIFLDRWWQCSDGNSDRRSDFSQLTKAFFLRKILKSTKMSDSFVNGIPNNYLWIIYHCVIKWKAHNSSSFKLW